MRVIILTIFGLLLSACGHDALYQVSKDEQQSPPDVEIPPEETPPQPDGFVRDCTYGRLIGVTLSSGVCFNEAQVTADAGYGEVNPIKAELEQAVVDYATVRFGELFCEEFGKCKTLEEYQQLYDLYWVFITFYQYNRESYNYNTQFDFSLLHSEGIPTGRVWIIVTDSIAGRLSGIMWAMLDLYTWIWDVPEEEQSNWYMYQFGDACKPRTDPIPNEDCPAIQYKFFQQIAEEVGLF